MAFIPITRAAEFGRVVPRSQANSTWKTRIALFAVALAGVAAYVALGSQLVPPRDVNNWSTTCTAELPFTTNHCPHE